MNNGSGRRHRSVRPNGNTNALQPRRGGRICVGGEVGTDAVRELQVLLRDNVSVAPTFACSCLGEG